MELADPSRRQFGETEFKTIAVDERWRRVDRDRRGVNSPDHCPNAARINASFKTNSGNAASANGTERMIWRSCSSTVLCDPIRHSTLDNLAEPVATAEFSHPTNMDAMD